MPRPRIGAHRRKLNGAQVLVACEGASSVAERIAFDHVVLALGAVSNYLGLHDVEAVALDVKRNQWPWRSRR